MLLSKPMVTPFAFCGIPQDFCSFVNMFGTRQVAKKECSHLTEKKLITKQEEKMF